MNAQKNTVGAVGVIGAGVMGRALLKGMLDQGIADRDHSWAAARSEETAEAARRELGLQVLSGSLTASETKRKIAATDLLLICVKPAQIDAVLRTLRRQRLPKSLTIVSIAAGVTLDRLKSAAGPAPTIVRAMPNTPCLVGQGMTVVCSEALNRPSRAEHMQKVIQAFRAVGDCLELEEKHFDAVTGLSGSGPAYLYLIMEALADGGVRVGLPRDQALHLVAQTVLGAATMVLKSGRHPASLRDDVTTPAGCTIGALLALEDGKIRSVLARAVEQAAEIAAKLGQQAKSLRN